MKRLILLVLSVALIIVPIYSLASDYSSMEFEELKTELDKIYMEICKRNINTEKVLCEDDGFKLYLDGDIQIEHSNFWDTDILVIPYIATNESNNNIQYIIEKISVNGWELEVAQYYALDSNKKTKGKIEINRIKENTDIENTEQIKEIETYYSFLDSNMRTIKDNCRTTVIINNK